MANSAKLLKPAEVRGCQKLAQSEHKDNQRAVALLAIHQGQTQARAAESSGLSLGQVKYIVTRFRKMGMKALTAVRESPANAVETAVESPQSKTKTKTKKNKDKADKKAKKDKDKSKKKDKKAKKDKKKSKKKNKNKK